jgi:hypothetical protein
VWCILINEDAKYEPASGEIERIDFNLDGKLPAGASGSRAVSLAVRQDELLWAACASPLGRSRDDSGETAAPPRG